MIVSLRGAGGCYCIVEIFDNWVKVAEGGEIGWFGDVPICCCSGEDAILEFIGILDKVGEMLCCGTFGFLEKGDKLASFF